MRVTVDGLKGWRTNCLSVAERLMEAGRPTPVSTAQLDQLLAGAREAGLTEREQGVLLLMVVDGAVERRGWSKRLTRSKRLAVSTAFAMRMLQSVQPEHLNR